MPVQLPPHRQPPAERTLLIAVVAAALARLATLGMYPLVDTTEARYAEIARNMAVLGDWVTPWFRDGLPFWGKPPLSFWLTAASFKAIGINAFAARLPHWICGCLLAWLVWGWLARRSRYTAAVAVALIGSSLLFLASAGIVMTDMTLALGTTLMLRGFWLGLHGAPAERRREQWIFFLGLAIGLMAKGPIAALLAGIPIAVWALGAGQVRRVLREFSWVRGLIATILVVAPWYAWAESRTPGFLEYFFVGEHWHRFVSPGWSGDLYGQAHDFPRGTIWLFAAVGFLPWTLLLPVAAWRWRKVAAPIPAEDRSLCGYLLVWGLAPCVVFSAAGNTLWPYVLPGLPALAILAAVWLAGVPRSRSLTRLLAGGVAFTAVATIAVVLGARQTGWDDRRSTQSLVAEYRSHRSAGEALVFFRKRPFSGDFYSGGRAEYACCAEDLQSRLALEPAFVAVKDKDLERLPDSLMNRFRAVTRKGEYTLFVASPGPGDDREQQSDVAADVESTRR